jgi:hypothetical protein
VPGRGETGHVDSDLGDDRSGGPLAHAGDGAQPGTGFNKRDASLALVSGEQGVDLALEPGDLAFQVLGVVEGHADHEGVMVTEAASQRLSQDRDLGSHPSFGQLGQNFGVAFGVWGLLSNDAKVANNSSTNAC